MEDNQMSQDTINALVQRDIKSIKDSMAQMVNEVKAIHRRMDDDGIRYLTLDTFNQWKKDEFNFWRGVLISGVLLSTFTGVIALVLQNIFKK